MIELFDLFSPISKLLELNTTGDYYIKANDWSPEKGYTTKDFDRTATPRPAVGLLNLYAIS